MKSATSRAQQGPVLPPHAPGLPPTELDDQRVTRAVEEYLSAWTAGHKPDRRQFLAQHAEIADALAECLDGLEFIQAAALDLPQPAADVADRSPVEPHLAVPLGDYRILREIGRGGMGVVYEAEQLSLGRRVALKVLPFAAALDAKQLQRFKTEAQAAAQLHHANIVPVYAVGCERGVHYYAMQFIDGQSLAAVIAELRQLSGQERGLKEQVSAVARPAPAQAAASTRDAPGAMLTVRSSILDPRSSIHFRTAAQLGVQAAEALEHAHQCGIVHRDIKPANLLVDAHGQLWVTDFGLAHVQGDPRLTMTGDLVGTLRYMSPEQALARRGIVDHRSDVYALGVTLYELLTLEPAFDSQDRREILHRIANEDLRSPRRLNPGIPADLATIVLKAVAKEPEGRYATAQDLADDLRRFLEDKPIKARKPSLAQRAARWARRHRAVVASAAVLLVLAVSALAVGAVLISLERGKAVQQRDAARRAVDDMYTAVAEKWLDQEPEMEEVQREFLLKALQYYQGFVQEERDPALRLATATAYRRMGDIQQKLGDVPSAEAAYVQALGRLDRLAADFPARREYRDVLAQCQHNLGTLLFWAKRHAEAELAYRRAVALRESLLEDAPASSPYRYDLAVSVGELGQLLHHYGRPQDAEQAYHRALQLLDDLAGVMAKDAAYQNQVGATLGRLAEWQRGSGDLEQTRCLLERAVEHQRWALQAFPRHPAFRVYLASQLGRLGGTLLQLEEFPEAEQAKLQAAALWERLAADFPRIPRYRGELADSHRDLGESLTSRGQDQEAARAYTRVVALRGQLVEEFPTSGGYARDLAWFLVTCPDPRFRDPDKAVHLARQAVELAPEGGDCWRTLGVASYRRGDCADAVAALTKARSFRSGGNAVEWFFLAMAHWRLGDQQQARDWYKRAVQWTEKNTPQDKNLGRFRAEAAALMGS